MDPQTFVFIGRSGCGKGTQAEILKNTLAQKDPDTEIMYLETGANFRKFISGDKYSNILANAIAKTGDRQPDFLAVWMWSHILVDNIVEKQHIIFDGISRSLSEAMTFGTAMDFYDRKPYIIHINVSRKWAENKLLARKRADDNTFEIEKRLDWFDKDVLPAIEYFNINTKYNFLDINGEQSIEDVHKEILEKIGW